MAQKITILKNPTNEKIRDSIPSGERTQVYIMDPTKEQVLFAQSCGGEVSPYNGDRYGDPSKLNQPGNISMQSLQAHAEYVSAHIVIVH